MSPARPSGNGAGAEPDNQNDDGELNYPRADARQDAPTTPANRATTYHPETNRNPGPAFSANIGVGSSSRGQASAPPNLLPTFSVPLYSTPPTQSATPATTRSPVTVRSSVVTTAPTSQSSPTTGNVSVPESSLSACLNLMQEQLRISKQILEILDRRDRREEQQIRERQEEERTRWERDMQEKNAREDEAKTKHRIQIATELLANPSIDASTRKSAGDFMKRLFEG